MNKKKPLHRFPRVMLVLVAIGAIAGAMLWHNHRVLGFFLGAYFGWWFVYPTIELILTDFGTLD